VQKLIAAKDVTQALVIVAVWPGWDEDLLVRCLVAAEQPGCGCGCCSTRSTSPHGAPVPARALAVFEAACPITELSVQDGAEQLLRPLLSGHVSVLVGPSGCRQVEPGQCAGGGCRCGHRGGVERARERPPRHHPRSNT
jgi:ribosome biogenesis GTPase